MVGLLCTVLTEDSFRVWHRTLASCASFHRVPQADCAEGLADLRLRPTVYDLRGPLPHAEA